MKIVYYIAISITCLQMAACQGAWLRSWLPRLTVRRSLLGSSLAAAGAIAAATSKPIVNPSDGDYLLPTKIELIGTPLFSEISNINHYVRQEDGTQRKYVPQENGAAEKMPLAPKCFTVISEPSNKHSIHINAPASQIILGKSYFRDSHYVTLCARNETNDITESIWMHFKTLEQVTLYSRTETKPHKLFSITTRDCTTISIMPTETRTSR